MREDHAATWPLHQGWRRDWRQTLRDLCDANALWGWWLGLIPLLSFVVTPPRGFIGQLGTVDTRTETTESLGITVAAVALGFLPAALTVVRRYVALDLVIRPAVLFLWILTLIAASFLYEITPKDFGMLAIGLYVMVLICVLCSQQEDTEEIVRKVFTALAVFQSVVMIVALVDNNYVVGRFQGRIGPNYWGSTAASTLLISYVIRSLPVRAVVMGICAYMLIVSQNRSGMIAAMAGSVMVALLYWLRANGRQRLRMVGAAVLGLIVLLAASPVIYSKVFLLDNARRGLESNGTGRFAAWQEALNIIYTHPLFGVGYRHHEQYITAASSAHNAYLAAMADMGVLGLLTYLVYLFGAMGIAIAAAMRRREWSYAVMAGVLFGYAAVNFLETRGINFANSVSLSVLCAVALILRANPPRMAAKQEGIS
ncbi:O-antigen ligase [Novosphingobium sp. SG751A]|uniref:O-antigen ligase family protein n=1 Tax=Novosphingobium sp. SG751A TaxID=2587000 RepID=UPI0015549317|nr:O-antigen ligase family protein [Novosphingobium sp. SG751A]NOW45600.1 O-antigen ligase [Novosphingobium sp. SG751A]